MIFLSGGGCQSLFYSHLLSVIDHIRTLTGANRLYKAFYLSPCILCNSLHNVPHISLYQDISVLVGRIRDSMADAGFIEFLIGC